MSSAADSERMAFSDETMAQAKSLALSIDDPAAIARNLAAWVKEHFPERIATAYWIKVNGDRDKGIEVRLYEKPLSMLGGLKLRFGALLGRETGGASVTIPFRTQAGYEIGVGVGAVVDYQTFRDIAAVAVLTVRF